MFCDCVDVNCIETPSQSDPMGSDSESLQPSDKQPSRQTIFLMNIIDTQYINIFVKFQYNSDHICWLI